MHGLLALLACCLGVGLVAGAVAVAMVLAMSLGMLLGTIATLTWSRRIAGDQNEL
jgi:hypothetical protein